MAAGSPGLHWRTGLKAKKQLSNFDKVDIVTFLQELFILEDGKPIRLEDWQRERIFEPVFYDLDGEGLRRINTALISVPKKNGKSTIAAAVAVYMLLADGETEPEVYGTAGDKDQARIVFRNMKKAIQRSPILRGSVNIYKNVIERRDGTGFYEVLSADAPTAHGLNAHCVIWDECHVHRNYDLWEALTHSPARKQPLHYVTSYAGYRPFKGDLLYDLYTAGLEGSDEAMYMFWSHENLASWVTDKYLGQQRKRLPLHIFQRLHENRWTTGSGTFLDQEDVDFAVDPSLANTTGQRGIRYYAGCDIGLSHDRTAVVVVHREGEKVIVDHLRLWQGTKKHRVQLSAVEEHLMWLAGAYPGIRISADPYQFIGSEQRLHSKGVHIREYQFTPKNVQHLTDTLLHVFKDRLITIPEHDELIKELLTLVVKDTSYGFRLDKAGSGHSDLAVSLGMAATECLARAHIQARPPDSLTNTDELTFFRVRGYPGRSVTEEMLKRDLW